jgi:phage tail-like protein
MPAPQFNANTTRDDLYKNYRFKVRWDGNYVAGFSRVNMKRSTEVAHRADGDPSLVRLSPGQSIYDPIILEQGLTHDVTFEQWANKTWSYHNSIGSDPDVSLKDFGKDITIELYNVVISCIRRPLPMWSGSWDARLRPLIFDGRGSSVTHGGNWTATTGRLLFATRRTSMSYHGSEPLWRGKGDRRRRAKKEPKTRGRKTP